MNCNEVKLEMTNMFNSDMDQTVLVDLIEHINQCAECSVEYQKTREVITTLTPRVLPNAPLSLKQNIINQIKMEEIKMKPEDSKTVKIGSRYRKILSIAAVLALLLMVIPIVDKHNLFTRNTAKAAGIFIKSSIEATHLIKSMIMKLKVRTVAHDNFSLVGTEYSMVEHTIWKSFEEPVRWRVDKGGRVVVFDGKSQYLWIPNLDIALKAGEQANFTEWLKILLDPEQVLNKEQKEAKDNNSRFLMKEKNGELCMTITSKARGNFMNDYLKNSSIDESDNRREYTFDSNTKLLKGLKIFILDGKKETLILEIEKITYDVPLDSSLFSINLPSGVEWKESYRPADNETYKNITSKRAAELFFQGMSENNWKTVAEGDAFFTGNSENIQKIKDNFGGLKVIKIGEPFKSGLYPGEFVPYEIKLKSGVIKKWNLALKYNNSNKTWYVDGGLD